jgi:valyl-tRNA synthetase
MISNVTRLTDKYELGLSLAGIYEFFWNDFCDRYIEAAKAQTAGGGGGRTATVLLLTDILSRVLRALHPYLPFVTEEIYSALPAGFRGSDSIMREAYPGKYSLKGLKAGYKAAETAFELTKRVREIRAEHKLPGAKKAGVFIEPLTEDAKKAARDSAGIIEKLSSGEFLRVLRPGEKPDVKCVSVRTLDAEIYVVLEKDGGAEEERAALEKELSAAVLERDRAAAKLQNPGFLQKAPPKLVEEEKAKHEKYKELAEKLAEKLG